MQITLDPNTDDAALNALYVYAALTENKALTKLLNECDPPQDRFETLFVDHDKDQFESAMRLAREGGQFEPVRLVVRRVENAANSAA